MDNASIYSDDELQERGMTPEEWRLYTEKWLSWKNQHSRKEPVPHMTKLDPRPFQALYLVSLTGNFSQVHRSARRESGKHYFSPREGYEQDRAKYPL